MSAGTGYTSPPAVSPAKRGHGLLKSHSFALAAEGFALPPALSPNLAMRRLATPAFRADAPRPASLLAPRRAARPGKQRPPAFARRDELPWAVLGKSPLLTTGRSSAEGQVGGRDSLFEPSVS